MAVSAKKLEKVKIKLRKYFNVVSIRYRETLSNQQINSKKRWSNPLEREIYSDKCKTPEERLKKSKAGKFSRLNKESVRKWRKSYKKRSHLHDKSHTKSKEHKNRMKQLQQSRSEKKKTKSDVELLNRVNNYAGVISEADFNTL